MVQERASGILEWIGPPAFVGFAYPQSEDILSSQDAPAPTPRLKNIRE